MRIIVASLIVLMAAPFAEAQVSVIDCSGGCSSDTYGFSDEPIPEGGSTREVGVILKTGGRSRLGRSDGVSCAGEEYFSAKGQALVTEQDSCTVTSTNRCQVEMPDIAATSGIFNQNRADIDLGEAGLVGVSAGILQSFQGNVGVREINGTCTVSGDNCGVDADCTGGGVCRSTCFSDPGTQCASDADCTNADCITAIDWDALGRCSDNAGDGSEICSRGGNECPAGESCLDGFVVSNSEESCVCCQSTGGQGCSLFGWVEYPALVCPNPSPRPVRRDGPDWIFQGGRSTEWVHDIITVNGQQEGVCMTNRQRSCGARGSFWAGSDEGKCQSGTDSCQGNDPFNPADPAQASECDDVAFGGLAGDFCDFREQGYRIPPAHLLPDNRPDPIKCPSNIRFMTGFPDRDCRIPVDIPEGDPQPGCRLNNFGIGGRPDTDCNGIDDSTEGRCHPDGVASCSQDSDCVSGICISDGDLCPFLEETSSFLDSNADGRGDQCQCGDVNGDGAISGPDIGGMALCANGAAFCDGTLSDTEGDNVVTANDIGGVVSVVNGNAQTTDLICVRDIDGSQP